MEHMFWKAGVYCNPFGGPAFGAAAPPWVLRGSSMGALWELRGRSMGPYFDQFRYFFKGIFLGGKKSSCGNEQSPIKRGFGRFGPPWAPWPLIRALWALFGSIPTLLRPHGPPQAPYGSMWAYTFVYIVFIYNFGGLGFRV